MMKPEKVLMSADTAGGVWTYSIELAAALAKKGVSVALATMGAPLSNEQLSDVKRVPGLECFESGFRLEWMDDPWENVRLAGQWLLRLERYVKPEMIHLNGYSHGSLPFKAPVVVVGHSCVLSWWEAVRGGRAPAVWHRYWREVSRGLACAGAVAAPTEAMLSSLRRFYDFKTPSFVIPNGRDASFFMAGEKENFIFTAGRLWDEAKNTAALQDVASSLPWPVYAAGQSRHSSGSLKENGRLKMLGALSARELATWLSKAAIFSSPALYEPFGLTALEAGLSGCALVLGDIPSLRETWDGAALFVDPKDRAALKEALLALINDKAMRSALSWKAMERALAYTPGRLSEGYLELYRAALSGRETAGEGRECAL
ncbi:hypothetical protein PLCT1_00661 [Planctomycetaceae bacterium]|nr:hypothetical protein PLCT1_00661 [Planctomycetaceae bacterium]